MARKMSSFDSARSINIHIDPELMEPIEKCAAEFDAQLKSLAQHKIDLHYAKDAYAAEATPKNKEKIKHIGESAKSAKKAYERSSVSLLDAVDSLSAAKNVPRTTIVKALKVFHTDHENQRMETLLQQAQTIDLCFVIDATGSMHMEGVFEALKSHIRNVVDSMKACNPHVVFQLSLVAYRDPEDGDKHLEVLPFTTSRTEFETFARNVKCTGGGDQCEDVLSGLKVASELKWKLCNRLLFLCGDAPCHGTEFHDGCRDKHPGGFQHLVSRAIMQKLVDQKVQMFFWKVNTTTDKMIRKLNEDARQATGTFPAERTRDAFIETTPIDVTSTTAIIKTVTSSITASMTGSMSRSVSKVGVMTKPLTGTFSHLEKIVEEDDRRSESLAKKRSVGKVSSVNAILISRDADGKEHRI